MLVDRSNFVLSHRRTSFTTDTKHDVTAAAFPMIPERDVPSGGWRVSRAVTNNSSVFSLAALTVVNKEFLFNLINSSNICVFRSISVRTTHPVIQIFFKLMKKSSLFSEIIN